VVAATRPDSSESEFAELLAASAPSIAPAASQLSPAAAELRLSAELAESARAAATAAFAPPARTQRMALEQDASE